MSVSAQDPECPLHVNNVNNEVVLEKEKSTEEFFQRYMLGKIIGGGNFSNVRMCVARETLEKLAVKCISIKEDAAEGLRKREARKEANVLKKLNHKNLLSCRDSFYDEEEILIVTEYAEHGDLYEMIAECSFMSEYSGKKIFKQILDGLNYLHNLNIVHRDIKPENFLIFYDNKGEVLIKMCDFGLAMEVLEPIDEVCGSPSYVAPEILKLERYGLPVDIWSSGVVLYILLVQFPPFKGEDNKELFSSILQGYFEFPAPYWDDISDSCKDLIKKLLETNPKRRLSAKLAVEHIWFQENDEPPITERKTPRRLSLRVAALAIRSVSRFKSRAIIRERAVLSSEMIKQSFKGTECNDAV